MSLSSIPLPNVAGLFESSQTLVFPASPIRAQIPVYLKFTCTEYGSNSLQRAGLVSENSAGVGNVKAYIAVPFPSKFTTQTAMRYKQEENPSLLGADTAAITKGLGILQQKAQRKLTDFGIGGRLNAIGAQVAARGGKVVGSLASLLESDFTETILQSGSKRTFQIQLYFPCLNSADSAAASNIIQAFEALSLPSYVGGNIGGIAGIDLFFHPPMWFIGAGPLGNLGVDPRWVSQPQASVLTNVAVNRTAIDATSLTALDSAAPLAYTVSLNFQEIEAAVRPVGGGFKILNRSAAGLSSVGSAVGAFGG